MAYWNTNGIVSRLASVEIVSRTRSPKELYYLEKSHLCFSTVNKVCRQVMVYLDMSWHNVPSVKEVEYDAPSTILPPSSPCGRLKALGETESLSNLSTGN